VVAGMDVFLVMGGATTVALDFYIVILNLLFPAAVNVICFLQVLAAG
jgi:hypothetical protein